MPRINNLPIDTTIKDNDYLIGYDGETGNSAKKYQLEELKDYFGDTTLDGFRSGRILMVDSEDFLESKIIQNQDSAILVSGEGTDEDEAVVATSSTVLQVGNALTSVVFSNAISTGDIIVIENQTTFERDFGIVEETDSSASTITLNSDHDLDDYTNFTSSKGYTNKLTIYRPTSIDINTDTTVDGDLKITGDILDGEGNAIIQSNPVTLDADNAFTGGNTFSGNQTFTGTNDFENDVSVHTQITIGDGGTDTYVLESPAAVPSNNQVLAIDTGDGNTMKFKDVGELITFGAAENNVAVWAEGNSTADIPGTRVSEATATALGAVKGGGNVTIGSDGQLNAPGTGGTQNYTFGSAEYTNATKLIFAGTAVGSISESGSDVTVTINSGSTSFGNASGNVAEWAEGDNTDAIPANKLSNVAITFGSDSGDVATWAEGDNTGDIPGSRVSDATDSAKGAVQVGDNLSISDGTITVGDDVVLKDENNTFSSSTGPITSFRRVDTTPTSNDIISRFVQEGYSLETEEYEDFVTQESRWLSDGDYEYGQYRINASYVTKSNDTFTPLTALTIDRYGLTSSVNSTLNENVTIGSAASKTLTVNATATFNEPISGSINQVVNDRDTSQNLKIWYGTQAQFDAIATKDANTIYYTT